MDAAPLRVLLDHRPAVYGDGGIGTYVRGLTAAYRAAFPQDDLLLLEARLRRGEGYAQVPLASDAAASAGQTLRSATTLRGMRRALAARLGRPWDGMAPCDLVHATDYVRASTRAVPLVVTLHDVLFASHPECYPSRMRRRLSRTVHRLAREAARIVVPSEASQRGLSAHFGIDPGRIDVIPHGTPRLPTAAAHEGDRPYLLAVGRLEPRKNHLRLVEAFRESRAAREGLELLVAGPRGWMDEPVLRAIEATPKVRWLGRVTRPALAALVRGARAVLYPTLAEGFGFPVLEALAEGRPVLVGAGTASAELAGQAALAVEPMALDALRGGIDRIALDEALRIRLMRLGPTQASRYPWEATARATRASYLRARAQ